MGVTGGSHLSNNTISRCLTIQPILIECVEFYWHNCDEENALMKTLAGTVHQGRVELTEQTGLVEGQTVIVVIPETQDVPLPAEAMKLLVRLDAFRSDVGPVGCSTRDLVRQGRRNGQ